MARRLTAAIVLAAGASTRFGSVKQFREIDGLTMVERAVRTAVAVAGRVVTVVPAGIRPLIDGQVSGGATRRESVAAGLAALDAEPDDATVLVHDAAHPLATPELAARVADRLSAGALAAVPVVPATDTVKTVTAGAVSTSIGRGAVLTQMPHAYELGVLRAAHRLDIDTQDDSGLVEALGVRVHVVDGEATNLHVTTPVELEMARALAPLVDRSLRRPRVDSPPPLG